MSKILTLNKLRPETALDNLNRLTGLDFQQWPESLIDTPVSSEAHQVQPDETKTPAQQDAAQAIDALLCQQG